MAARASTKTGSDRPAVVVALAAGIVVVVGLLAFFFVQRDGGFDIAQANIMVAIVAVGIATGFVALLRRRG